MIPILYAAGASTFTSGGKGRLTDAISCKITQELNGIYELELVYPTNGPRFNDLMAGGVIRAMRERTRTIAGKQLKYLDSFDIYKSSVTADGLATFNACHVSYRLNNSVITGLAETSPSSAVSYITANATPSVSAFTITASGNPLSDYYRINDIRTVRQALAGNEDSICAVFNLEMQVDNFEVKLAADDNYYNGTEIRLGKNFTDGLAERDDSQTFNAIAPYYLKDGVKVVTSPLIVQPTTPISPVKVRPWDMTANFDTQPTAATLKTAAQNWLNIYKPWEKHETVNISFAPNWKGDGVNTPVQLGGYVKVFWSEGDIVGDLVRVVKTVYDPIMERYDSMELGTLEKGYVATETW